MLLPQALQLSDRLLDATVLPAASHLLWLEPAPHVAFVSLGTENLPTTQQPVS